MSEFGTYLRTQRKRSGLTQQQLAKLTGIDFTYISKLENNVAPAPSIQTLRRMADAFNVSDHEVCAAAGRLDQAMTKQELESHVLRLHAEISAQVARSMVQQDEIDRLRETLEWYGDADNYEVVHTGPFSRMKAADDNGERARIALEGNQP